MPGPAKKAAKAPYREEKVRKEIVVAGAEKEEVVGDGVLAVINVDIGNGFAFLDGEEDDEAIIAAARSRFEAEKVKVKAEKAAEKARLKAAAEEKAPEAEMPARRWNYSRQPYNGETGNQTQQYRNRNAGAGYYRSDHRRNNSSGWSNGNRLVSGESRSHGADNVNGVYNGQPNNGSSSRAPQEGNGGTNHNGREVVQQWVRSTSQPSNAPPQDSVSDENQQVVDAEEKSHSVESRSVEEKKKVVVVEEDNSKLMTLKEYLEKKKELVSLKGGEDCRKVTIDKDFQSMKPLGKKTDDKKLTIDQKASQNKEEKKAGVKAKAPQHIVAQKIGLRFCYKQPIEWKKVYNNAGRDGDGNAMPNAVLVGENIANNSKKLPNGADRGVSGNNKPNADGNARPSGADGGNNGNNSEVQPNGGDRRQYVVNAGRGGAGYKRPNAGRGQGTSYDRPNGAGRGQEAEGNVAPVREARHPSLRPPRVEDPAQFPALGSKSA